MNAMKVYMDERKKERERKIKKGIQLREKFSELLNNYSFDQSLEIILKEK